MKKGLKQTLCWDCANAYATKCEKFHTDGPLDIWTEYEIQPLKMSYPNGFVKVTDCFVVLGCKNFELDKKLKGKVK
jgi:hypothetical protein